MRSVARITQPEAVPSSTALQVAEESGPIFQGAEYTKIGAGKYSAQCVQFKTYRDPGFNRWVVMLRFRLIEGGQEVCAFYNLGRREDSCPGRRSRYWKAWTIANGAAPRKGQRVYPKVFRGKVFLVEVSDVMQDSEGKPHHASAVYSKVENIIEKEAG